ncbi:hypothetical protein HZA43_04720 [Candidatus Peregrinibacteria bacterium]|nr:hypothetical protein [Candidatus Peregrinibacteria bacterium]
MAETQPKSAEAQAELKKLLEGLKDAFNESRLEEAHRLIEAINKIDSENGLAKHIAKKIADREAQAIRESHKEEIALLEAKLKEAFKEARFDEVRSLSESLKKLDPTNKAAVKWVGKIEAEEAEAKKAEQKAIALKKKEEEGLVKETAKQKEEAEKQALKLKEKAEKEKQIAEAKATKEEAKKQAAAQRIPWSVRLHKAIESVKGSIQKMKAKLVAPKKEETAAGISVALVAPEQPTAASGNMFTRLFQKKAEEAKEESIIETIVAQADEKKVAKQKASEDAGFNTLSLAKMTLEFSIVFILLTAGFLYAQVIDESNTVLGLFGVQSNAASQLHGASERLKGVQDNEQAIKKGMEVYQKGYNNKYEKTIQAIVSKRIDWTEIINKIDEIANSVYEHNALSQYIQFSGYSFNGEKKQVTVNGTLSDPLGQNLTKLTELEEAFRYYPKDKDNSDDKTAPYFYGVEGSASVGKTFNQKDNKYVSTFRFTFFLEKQVDAKKAAKNK